MAARYIFRVFFKKDKWLVLRDSVILGSYENKDKAIQKAMRLAARFRSSQVLVYRTYGSIEDRFFNSGISSSKSLASR